MSLCDSIVNDNRYANLKLFLYERSFIEIHGEKAGAIRSGFNRLFSIMERAAEIARVDEDTPSFDPDMQLPPDEE